RRERPEPDGDVAGVDGPGGGGGRRGHLTPCEGTEGACSGRLATQGVPPGNRKVTSAAMPDLNRPWGSATRTLTPNTWCRRSSRLWTLRGVNSLALAMYHT